MTNVDCDVRYCDFYLGSVAPGGYVWIFPKGEGLANVGIGVQLSQIHGTAEAKQLPRPLDREAPRVREGEDDRRRRRRRLDLRRRSSRRSRTGSCSSATPPG